MSVATPRITAEAAFLAAVERRENLGPDSTTDTWLEELCERDARLSAEVRSLLSHLDELGSDVDDSGGFLDPAQLHGSRAEALQQDAQLREWGGGAVGQRLGDFVIIGQLGSGGMGIVYIAEQQRPRRTVALKVIRHALATRPMIARFEREAELLGRLSHPGIAQIYVAGVAEVRTGEGRQTRVPYIAMERVDGPTITEHVHACQCAPGQIVALLVQTCEAIHHAHQRGVIHRDLKPANVLIARGEHGPQVKVLDFGVARAVSGTSSGDESLVELTSHGHLIGTPAYMSPEQITGHGHEVTAAADVYALGAILFQLLTGQPPIDLSGRPLHEVARRVVEVVPPRIGLIDRKLRGDLETIVAKAMEKDPARRYPSAAALGRDLQCYSDGQPVQARTAGSFAPCLGWLSRQRRLVALSAVCAIAVATAGLCAFKQAARRAAVDANVRALGDALADSQLELARSRLKDGDVAGAEAIVWREYANRPDAPLVRSVLHELLSHGNATRDLDGNLIARTARAGGMLLAHGDALGLLKVANEHDGRRLFECATTAEPLMTLAYTASGDALLVAGAGGVRVFRTSDGAESRSVDFHAAAADISRDGKLMAAVGDDGNVRVWDVATGNEAAVTTKAGAAGRSIRLNAAANRLAAMFDDGDVDLWAIESLHGIATLRQLTRVEGKGSSSATGVGFSQDGHLLAVSGSDGSLRLWRAVDGQREQGR